jgi:hypothetical protein
MDKAEFDAITERIIGAAHKVSNGEFEWLPEGPNPQAASVPNHCKPQTWKYAKQ